MSEIKYKKPEEVENKGTLRKKVMYKPVTPFWIMILVGLAIILLGGYMNMDKIMIIVGSFTILYSLFMLINVKDYLMIGIYNEYLMLYNGSGDMCKLNYDDIIEYNISKKDKNFLFLKLKDKTEIMKKSYRLNKEVAKLFKELLPNKETDEIKALREQRKKQ